MTQDNATTDTLLTTFETWLKSHGRSAHSLRAYRSDVSQLLPGSPSTRRSPSPWLLLPIKML